MDELLILLLLAAGFVSFIPVVNMIKNSEDRKYRCLKFLMNATFVWTILILIERVSSSNSVIYYAHMLGYPLKFLVASFMLCTVFNYVEQKMPKMLLWVLGITFLAEYLIAITNSSTLYIINLSLGQLNSFHDLYTSSNGPLFIYHLLITYLVLFSSIIYLFYFLQKKKGIRQYRAVSRTMVISIIIVLSFNMFQLFLVDSSVDLTYISLVIVSYALYLVIYSKDMIFNLLTSGRGKILTNMRELYILTDAEKRIVEFSELLGTKYQVNLADFIGKDLDFLLDHLKDKIAFYQNYDVEGEVASEKDHYHLRERKFVIQGNNHGYMILLYDETQVFKLLRELNMLSNYDSMTGLNNRNYIESKLSFYNHKPSLGVISLDLNGLKVNNDYIGHERGDFLLRSLANNLKVVMSHYPHKEIARIGGDEFLVIVPSCDLTVMEKIKEDILSHCTHENLIDRISVSIGLSFDSTGKYDIYELIQKADQAMYQMKSQTSSAYSKEIVAYAKKLDQFIR